MVLVVGCELDITNRKPGLPKMYDTRLKDLIGPRTVNNCVAVFNKQRISGLALLTFNRISVEIIFLQLTYKLSTIQTHAPNIASLCT